MRDAGIAVYEHIGKNISDLPIDEKYQFVVRIYKTDINKDLIFIDYTPFENEEQEWPPKSYIYDQISGQYKIYFKGIITPSCLDECIGLESAAVWHTNHIIDRILGETKWGGILRHD